MVLLSWISDAVKMVLLSWISDALKMKEKPDQNEYNSFGNTGKMLERSFFNELLYTEERGADLL